MATFIPKAQVQGYKRWEAESFDPPPLAPVVAPLPLPDQEVLPPPSLEVTPAFSLPTAEEIEQIHNQAQTEGYQAGYQQGLQEGTQAGEAKAQAHIEEISALLTGLQQSLSTFDQEMAESVLACSLVVAQQMAKTTLALKPELLLPIIREALGTLPPEHGEVTLLLHPDQEGFIKEQLGEQFQHAGWKIQADDSIAPGGCKVRAGATEVDATIPSRWRRVLEAIGQSPEWLDAQP